MKTAVLFTVTLLAATWTVRADFSYTTTQKATGGQMAAMAAGSNQSSKFYLKGQKMKTESADTATILDFEAQTITTVNHRQKTYTVRKFSDFASATNGIDAKIDVRETGQQKVINGYNARELVMTMEMENPAAGRSPAAAQMGKMQMEMDLWLSSDPPGAGEVRTFYQKNSSRLPWAAMANGANPSMQAAMAQLQRKMAEMNGVQVMEVMKMKMAGGAAAMPAMPQMTPEQMAQMKAAIDKLQAQGGAGAAAAQQAMARMQAMQQGGGAAPGAGSGSLMEMTMEQTDFSTGSIPESVFAIPAGYQKVDQK
jgi:hypothetical protein